MEEIERRSVNKGGKSTIGKMMIRGIRSFDPNHEETIEFYSPLTMIIGANGCGKTTIIECLKYATTGVLPPNSRAGHSFVNDPGMTDSSEVKAQIKLRFNNAAGEVNVVSRSLQLTKKKVKMEFKALDGLLRIKDSNGKPSSISYKCAELDKQVPMLLCVTPAILENVIFTHQEEASWPMGDGATLKKKFDDIFESTRYTKALDAFLKSKKEFAAKAKDLKAEVLELGAHLQAAKASRQEHDECNEKAEEFRGMLETLSEKIEGIQGRIDEYKREEAANLGRYAELAELERSLAELDRRILDKSSNLQEKYSESDTELQGMLNNFEAVMLDKQRQHHTLKHQVDSIASEIEALRNKSDQLMRNKGTVESLTSSLQTQEKKYRDQAGHISRRHDIQGNIPESGPAADRWKWAPVDATRFADTIDSRVSDMLRDADDRIHSKRELHTKESRKLIELQHTQDKFDMELETKNKQANKLYMDIDSARGSIMQLNQSKSKLDNKRREYEEAQRQLSEFVNRADAPQSQFSSASSAMETRPGFDAMGCYLGYDAARQDLLKRINAARDLLSKASAEYTEDESILASLSTQRKELIAKEAAVALAAQDIKDEKEKVAAFWIKSRSVLQDAGINGEAPVTPDDLGRRVAEFDTRFSQCDLTLRRESDDLRKCAADVSAESALLNELRKRKVAIDSDGAGAEQETQFRAMQQEFLRIVVADQEGANVLRFKKKWGPNAAADILAETDSPERLLEYIKVKMVKAENNNALVKSSEVMQEKFQAKLESSIATDARGIETAACPCCNHRINAAEQEVYRVNLMQIFETGNAPDPNAFNKINADVNRLKGDIEAVEQSFAETRRKRAEAANIGVSLQMKEASLAAKKDTENQVRATCENLEKQKKEWSAVLQRLNDIKLSWLSKLENHDGKMREKERITGTYGRNYGNRSIEDIEAMQAERLKTQKDAQRDKDMYSEQEKDLERKHFALKQNEGNKHTDLLQVEKDCSMLGEYEASLASSKQQVEGLESELRAAKAGKEEVTREMAGSKLEVSAAKVDLDNTEQQCKADLDAIRSARDGLRVTNEALQDLTAKLLSLDAHAIVGELEKGQHLIQGKIEEKRQIEQRMQIITTEISSQENTKRAVRENLELREMSKEKKQIVQRCDDLKLKHGLGDEDGDGAAAQKLQAVQRDIQRQEQQKGKYHEETYKCKGRLEVLEQQQSDIDAKLRTPVYKNIEDRHRKKCIQYETTELAAKDLDTYYQALDGALQSFHTLKIKEINKIVRELWQLIYKGQDIDMIELESGVEDGAATRSTRSYNYRVVMRKGDTPLDMRGRCSAGQRVLAAIVIRLALAETFCLDCGLLTLDEPTTNLDEANRAGLAHALARIIISRQRQQNFQLICITHDEEFVKLMNTELAANTDFSLPEYYFKISREEDEEGKGKYFSKIERILWADM